MSMIYRNILYSVVGSTAFRSLCILCLLTGCSSDDTDGWNKDSQAIRIDAAIGANKPNGRVTDTDSGSTWNDNDQITVREILSRRSVNYTYSSGTWRPATTGEYLRWEEGTGGETSFIGWHPADNMIDGHINFTLPEDQTKGITAADWMVAQATTTQSDDKILHLTFQRRMAKVTMIVESWNEQFAAGDAISDFRICSAYSAMVDNELNAPFKEIKAWNSNGKTQLPALNEVKEPINKTECPQYTAIVFPTDVQPTLQFMKCKVKGYDLTLTGIPKLEAGIRYTYYLTVGKASITVSNVKVNDWQTGKDITGDAPEQ